MNSFNSAFCGNEFDEIQKLIIAAGITGTNCDFSRSTLVLAGDFTGQKKARKWRTHVRSAVRAYRNTYLLPENDSSDLWPSVKDFERLLTLFVLASGNKVDNEMDLFLVSRLIQRYHKNHRNLGIGGFAQDLALRLLAIRSRPSSFVMRLASDQSLPSKKREMFEKVASLLRRSHMQFGPLSLRGVEAIYPQLVPLTSFPFQKLVRECRVVEEVAARKNLSPLRELIGWAAYSDLRAQDESWKLKYSMESLLPSINFVCLFPWLPQHEDIRDHFAGYCFQRLPTTGDVLREQNRERVRAFRARKKSAE